MTNIGLGIMRCNQDNNTLIQFIRNAYNEGIDYFESSQFYLGYQCESILGEALSVFPRDSYQICAKLDGVNIDENIFNKQLRHHRTNYFDIYLLQGINRHRIPSYKTIKFLLEKKRQGVIRSLGFSFHDNFETLKRVFEVYDGWDCVQLKINYHDWIMNLDIQPIYNYVVKKGIPITVMAPLNGGLLTAMGELVNIKTKNIPDWTYAQIALRFLNTLKIHRVLLGATTVSQLVEDMVAIDSGDFSNEEMAFCQLAVELYKKRHYINCTGCKYCEVVCRSKIAIADYFTAYNNMLKNKDKYIDKLVSFEQYRCVECGRCSVKCPQGLDIPFILKNYIYHTRV